MVSDYNKMMQTVPKSRFGPAQRCLNFQTHHDAKSINRRKPSKPKFPTFRHQVASTPQRATPILHLPHIAMRFNLRSVAWLKIHPTHHQQQLRFIAKVRLKWVKNRSLDHIIDTETDLKAACLLKDAIKRSSTGFLTSKSVADWQKLLGLTIPVLRFLRRYPTLFHEFPHVKYASLPCFKLTDTATVLDAQEQNIHQVHEDCMVDRLCRVLMMTRRKNVPLQSLHPLKWDFGLPDDFHTTLVKKYPEYFKVVNSVNGMPCLKLLEWRDDLAVSQLQRSNEGNHEAGNDYRTFKQGRSTLTFPMSFPRGYGGQKKVKMWMDEFHKLPYISPYEDCSRIDPNSELMEKRVVGVLHEILSLTIHKKTKRNYLRGLREELGLPHKFTRLFTRYPGIFYLSLKCKTTTVALKEGYRRGKLVSPHPLTRIREKYYYVMRTGLLYRNKGINLIPPEALLVDGGDSGTEQDESDGDEEDELHNESYQGENSESGRSDED